jgi:hypothetical protein
MRTSTFHRADPAGVEGRHVDKLVGDDCAPRRCFDQRVDVDQLRTTPVGFGQPGQHAWCVAGRVVAHQPDRVGLLPVVEVNGAFAGADRGRQCATGCFVAHIRAVRQVVGAELAYPQLVEEGRLVAEPPRGIEGRLIGTRQTAEVIADQRERIVPGNWSVPVGRRVICHRLGEPADHLQVVIAPLGEFADGMRREELAIGLGGSEFPGDVLDAVLAHIEVEASRVVGPGAARAVEAAVLLIHHEEGAKALYRFARAFEHAPDAARGTPSGRRVMVLVSRKVTALGWSSPQRRLAGYGAEHPRLAVLGLARPGLARLGHLHSLLE